MITQVHGGPNTPLRVGAGVKEPSQIVVIKIREGVFVQLALARIISLQLTLRQSWSATRYSGRWRGELPASGPICSSTYSSFCNAFQPR